MLRVAVVGFGYWGPNVARNLRVLGDADVVAVCDTDVARLEAARVEYPLAHFTPDVEDVLADPGVDAVVIATPASTHYDLALRSLEAGKHALVEKPLATSAHECADLGGVADDRGLGLMVGHTFLYNSAVRWLRECVLAGDLGDLLYVYAQRLNLGRLRHDVNVLWNLAPHDISILLYLLGEQPVTVSARGNGYVQPDVEDVVFLTLEFPAGRLAHLHVSWLDPRKVRQVTVVGTRKMAVYDDVDVDARIRVYDKGIDVVPHPEGEPRQGHRNLGEFQTLVRSGDLLVPRIDYEEPLRVQCREFVDAVREGRRPLTDARHAAQVVRILEAASHSLEKGGEAVDCVAD